MDEFVEVEVCDAGPAHLAAPVPVGQLVKHFHIARIEIVAAAFRGDRDGELLALGAVRAVYWLALGCGEHALAADIGDWWEATAPVHGLGEVIL